MSKRLLIGVLLLGGLGVAAQPAGDGGTILISLIDRPVGRETYSSKADGAGTSFSAELDLTERNGRLQISSSMRLDADLTPTEFTVKGKSYRFVNVDAAVKVAVGIATVTSLGETKTFEAPRRFFTAQSYAPLSARALLIRYWKQHGQPQELAVLPGEHSVRITLAGRDTVMAGGAKKVLSRYSIDGVVWGKETLWLEDGDRFAAIVSRIHILPIEAVREDLKDAWPELRQASIKDRIGDLAGMYRSIGAVAENEFALRGVHLIDGTGRPPIQDAIVVVRGGRIAAAGPRASTPIPPGLRVIDAAGATVAPGLWEMHAHAAQVEWMPAYLAAGVTTVRDMGGEMAYLTALESVTGGVLKPRLLLAGLVDGDAPGAFGSVVAGTPAQGRAIVDQYKKAGFVQMKLYSLLQPDVVSAITARAHELGMSVTGHVPASLGLTKAVEAGMDHVAHLPINGDPQSPQTRATIQLLAQHKTVIDPTLPWNELLGHAPETPLESFEPGFAHAPPALLANYRSIKNDTDAATAKRRVRDSEAMVKALFDAGVPIVAGTDGALPGYSLLRSIEMYVEAGLTPMQAIESATRVPAESMGLANDTGTIEIGKRADMIVLNADPLAQISNIRKLRWVIANGRILDPARLWSAAGFK
ncbi:MAG TPA: amidohydrolase family protein [Vicinamibacterales bacterium]|nr:amidohydrolase family protein [Vicinamibacterales bacterium]